MTEILTDFQKHFNLRVQNVSSYRKFHQLHYTFWLPESAKLVTDGIIKNKFGGNLRSIGLRLTGKNFALISEIIKFIGQDNFLKSDLYSNWKLTSSGFYPSETAGLLYLKVPENNAGIIIQDSEGRHVATDVLESGHTVNVQVNIKSVQIDEKKKQISIHWHTNYLKELDN